MRIRILLVHFKPSWLLKFNSDADPHQDPLITLTWIRIRFYTLKGNLIRLPKMIIHENPVRHSCILQLIIYVHVVTAAGQLL
jgi:hypothetical protein